MKKTPKTGYQSKKNSWISVVVSAESGARLSR